MQTIMLIMRRRPIAQALTKKLAGNSEASIILESNYALAERAVLSHNAAAALIEVGETDNYDTAHCLNLCARLRSSVPSCKLILMCPEQNEASVLGAVAAKKSGRIEDFVFYDASLDYLISKLLSML